MHLELRRFLATPQGFATMAELVVASNRGPVQFEVDDDGNLSMGRGAGGMVAALGPALAARVAPAAFITDGDRVAARRIARSGRLRAGRAGPGRGACAAWSSTPGVRQLLQPGRQPDHLVPAPLPVRRPATPASTEAWVAWQHYEEVNRPSRPPATTRPTGARRCSPRTTTWPWSRRCCAGAGPTCASPTSPTARGRPRLLHDAARRVAGPSWRGCSGPTCSASGPAGPAPSCRFEASYRGRLRAERGHRRRRPPGAAWTYPRRGGRRGPAERADQADARAQERVVADPARGRSLIVRVDRGAVQEHPPRGLEGYACSPSATPGLRW